MAIRARACVQRSVHRNNSRPAPDGPSAAHRSIIMVRPITTAKLVSQHRALLHHADRDPMTQPARRSRTTNGLVVDCASSDLPSSASANERASESPPMNLNTPNQASTGTMIPFHSHHNAKPVIAPPSGQSYKPVKNNNGKLCQI